MSHYDIPGYDAWKTATPWDNDVAKTVTFTCEECEVENTQKIEVDRYADTALVDCSSCDKEQEIDLG
jgi:transcription elongation factor Elf1